ncbi:MmcQ/YjbR family DNA-binding protein [Oceaniglobus roseus]|uniref:MmcQ/YjbR family DNA-binding protein n=1 Tax=Oceaniglobus roseus TaxID=1737570 RepID=UPI000C7EA0D3|nr:MmcQ/YjbR family DNA-binding protein [Kandeliimicrobium roseum]
MSRDTVNRICAALPGAENSDPWGGGHDAWKVGGKMFAVVGTSGTGVSVKCPDVGTAEMLVEVGAAERAPYFHRSWVHLPFATTDAGALGHRIESSYATIRAGLPKKVRAALG